MQQKRGKIVRRYILNKYSYIINKENKGFLDFCSLIVFYILCFCVHVLLPVIALNEFIAKEACKCFDPFFIVSDKRNNFIIYDEFFKSVNSALKERVYLFALVLDSCIKALNHGYNGLWPFFMPI